MGTRKTILLVDDDTDQLFLISQLLETEGFAVLTADSVELALSVLEETPVDAVVTDHAMPKLNGVDLINLIRANPESKTLPLVLLAAAEPSPNACPLEKYGADAFFLKQDLKVRLIPALNSLLKD